MRFIILVMLLAFLIQTCAEDAQAYMKKMRSRSLNFIPQTSPLHPAGLDNALLGKPGNPTSLHSGLTFPRSHLSFAKQGGSLRPSWNKIAPQVANELSASFPATSATARIEAAAVNNIASPFNSKRSIVRADHRVLGEEGTKEEESQFILDPIRRVKGTVTLPGSKSLSSRVLLLASMSTGTTVVENLGDSDDVRYMIGALKQLGVDLDESQRLSANRVVVTGNGGAFNDSKCKAPCTLDLGNAGTAMRSLVAILAASRGKFTLDGSNRMQERPIQDLIEGLDQLGGTSVTCTQNSRGKYPPVSMDANGLRGGSCKVSGMLSSQYVSALLMAAPLAKDDVIIEVKDELISKPYVDMTVGLMRKFGVLVEEAELSSDPSKPRPRYKVPGGQQYKSPGSCLVEGDASSASYFLGLAAIGGGPVTVVGCGSESVQSDVKFANVLEKMGATVEWSPTSITVSRKMDGTQPLYGVDIDCGAIPDAAMSLAAVALFAGDGNPTVIRNVYNWRIKETDRMKAIITEFEKLGALVEEGRDYCVIQPLTTDIQVPHSIVRAGVAIDTYNDHRMAMAFSLVACAGVPVIINDPSVVAKTFPTYFDELKKLCAPALS